MQQRTWAAAAASCQRQRTWLRLAIASSRCCTRTRSMKKPNMLRIRVCRQVYWMNLAAWCCSRMLDAMRDSARFNSLFSCMSWTGVAICTQDHSVVQDVNAEPCAPKQHHQNIPKLHAEIQSCLKQPNSNCRHVKEPQQLDLGTVLVADMPLQQQLPSRYASMAAPGHEGTQTTYFSAAFAGPVPA